MKPWRVPTVAGWLSAARAVRLAVALAAARCRAALGATQRPAVLAAVQGILAAAAVLGPADAVSGASTATLVYNGRTITLNTSPGDPAPTARLTATNGAAMGFRASVVVQDPASGRYLSSAGYTYLGLPPGLSGTALGVVAGTPTAPGAYPTEITGYLDWPSLWSYDLQHGRFYTVDVVINVLPGADSGVPKPVITVQPQPQRIPVGGTAQFSVAATGSNLVYQWYANASKLSTATNAAFQVPGVKPSFAAVFEVVVSNFGGSVTSSPAPLTVLPAFTSQTWPQAAPLPLHQGEVVTLSAAATGPLPLSYQWYRDSLPAGPAGASVTLGPMSGADGGAYYAVVESPSGAATNPPVRIEVLEPLHAEIQQAPGAPPTLRWNGLPGRRYGAETNPGVLRSGWAPWSAGGLTNGTPLPAAGSAEFLRIQALDP